MRTGIRRRQAQVGFEAISVEGGLLSPEWLARIAQLSAGNQADADYRIPNGLNRTVRACECSEDQEHGRAARPRALNVRDEIGRYWRIAQAHWRDFVAALETSVDPKHLSDDFVARLLGEAFGFLSISRVEPIRSGDHVFPIDFAALEGRVPIVVAPAAAGLDTPHQRYGDGGRRRTAFGLLQEYLNAQDGALWGLASDGTTVRVLRDNVSLTRPAWIEANLRRIFEEERYADFAALWLTIHESRFGRAGQPVEECALEAWRRSGMQEGTRAREQLRQGVEEALLVLGNGFLRHPDNKALRAKLEDGGLSVREFFNQLLRTVYRLISLLTVEERGLLHEADAPQAARQLYSEGYGMRRLRARSAKRRAYDRFADLWEGVKIVFRGLASGERRLGLPALGGIFAAERCPDLDACRLENAALLGAVHRLAWLRQPDSISRVNWQDMGPEELGGVYESLLELVPALRSANRSFEFGVSDDGQHARRATGSYYTPEKLVRTLLDRTLEPVIERTVRENPTQAADALLGLAIVDPTCGSGHFLLAAARRLAAAVARHRAQTTPTNSEYRQAVREVVGRCIFGVDLNPLAVELCKVSLWMEAVEPGKPLSFLDSHIQHGNALLGARPEWIAQGVPDEAWDAVEGEDKKVAKALKRRNSAAAAGQRGLETLWSAPRRSAPDALTEAVAQLEASSDADLAALVEKQAHWTRIIDSEQYKHERVVADAWCAAFMWPKDSSQVIASAPTDDVWRQMRDRQGCPAESTVATVRTIASRHHFFHWHLAFPQVFAQGGFDLVIGNPPWIAHAGRAAQPLLPEVKRFCKINYSTFAGYPTTHGMFIGMAGRLLREGGGVGIIVPSSVSELPKYEPTRRAHDELCDLPDALVDFGEGQFPGVTQPCMALTSRRRAGGRAEGTQGEPWTMERPDLDETARALLDRLATLPSLPRELFAERGFQSDQAALEHILETPSPQGRYTLPLREGTDVREFQLLLPRLYADPTALGSRLRGPDEYQAVRFVVRNTARYPIAATSDGKAFRNSLLAGFESDEWPAVAA
ncbi:MAG: N-6 DNA methylase, partial [Polyangiaceae bacterium]|nr:N-6 DNA methylase [Polyangiaceae bacterium]